MTTDDPTGPEQLLTNARPWLQTIVDHASAVVYVKDCLSRHLLVNRRFEELFGVRRGDVIGKTNAELFPAAIADALTALDRRVIETGVAQESDEVVDHPDGARRFRSLKVPLAGPDGRVVGLCGLSTDVTEQRRAEERLRQQRELTERLIQSSTDGILAFDRECRYTVWNTAMEALAGVPAERVLGRRAFDLFPFLVETGEDRCFQEVLAGRSAVSRDRFFSIPESGRQGYFEGYYSPVQDVDGTVIGGLGIIRDVTERRLGEEERLALARAEAARVEAEASARRFAFLAEAGEVLASSLDYEQTLQDVARLAVPTLGDLCIVDVLEEGRLRRVATVHVSPLKGDLVDRLRRLYPASLDSPQPAGRVIRSGQPELLEIVTPDVVAAHSRDAEHASLIRAIGIRSHLAVPLIARGNVLGVLSLAVTESDRRYGPDDLALARDLARRAALAVDNARLYQATQQELAQRRDVEEALRMSEGRFRAVMEQSPLSIQIFRADGAPIRANQAWERLWGVTLADIPHYNILKDQQLETLGIAAYIRRAFAGESVEIPHARYDPNETIPDVTRNEDPARWVRAFAYPIKNSSGRVEEVVLVHEDVTARVRAEEALRTEHRRKDEFLATLAHELRNPLAPLRTGLEILRHAGTGPTAERTRDMMARQMGHMVRLIDDLLDLSRVTRGKVHLFKEPTDLASIVGTALEASRPLIDAAGLELVIKVPQTPLVLNADRTRLAQVLSNLLNNAAKYTDRGGRVEVEAERDERGIVIRVRDTGIGIPRDMLTQVFEMFAQVGRSLDRSQGGLGIGLTLVKRLVELHDGQVWAESEGPGTGSTFVVWLPEAHEAALPVQPPPHEDVAQRVPSRRVLVVDDNEDAAESLAMLLELHGHQVRIASSGPAALELVGGFEPEVAFLDIGLPGMSGYDLARRLREHPPLTGIKLVAVTGWGQEEDRRRSRAAGFDHHLTKPIDPRELEALVASLPA